MAHEKTAPTVIVMLSSDGHAAWFWALVEEDEDEQPTTHTTATGPPASRIQRSRGDMRDILRPKEARRPVALEELPLAEVPPVAGNSRELVVPHGGAARRRPIVAVATVGTEVSMALRPMVSKLDVARMVDVEQLVEAEKARRGGKLVNDTRIEFAGSMGFGARRSTTYLPPSLCASRGS